MKKLFAVVCTLVLGGALAVAQTAAPSGTAPQPTTKTTKAKKSTKKSSKMHHKGGKKGKKKAAATATPSK